MRPSHLTLFVVPDGVLHPSRSVVDASGSLDLSASGVQPFCDAALSNYATNVPGLELVLLAPWLRRMSREQLRSQLPDWESAMVADVLDCGGQLDDDQKVVFDPGQWPAVAEHIDERRPRHWFAVVPDDRGWPTEAWVRERLFVVPQQLGFQDASVHLELRERVNNIEREAPRSYLAWLFVLDAALEPRVIQESYRLRYTLPPPNQEGPASFSFLDEIKNESFEAQKEGSFHGEDVVEAAVRFICLARYGSPDVPTDDAIDYPWTEAWLVIYAGDDELSQPIWQLVATSTASEPRTRHFWAGKYPKVTWKGNEQTVHDGPVRTVHLEALGVAEGLRQ